MPINPISFQQVLLAIQSTPPVLITTSDCPIMREEKVSSLHVARFSQAEASENGRGNVNTPIGLSIQFGVAKFDSRHEIWVKDMIPRPFGLVILDEVYGGTAEGRLPTCTIAGL